MWQKKEVIFQNIEKHQIKSKDFKIDLQPNSSIQHKTWGYSIQSARDNNSTRGCRYPRILDPTGACAGSIFHPWVVDLHPHLHIAGADAGAPVG